MADIDDTETEFTQMTGAENSWTGRVLARLIRAVRFSHGRIVLLAGRTQALEDRVAAIEARLPPQ